MGRKALFVLLLAATCCAAYFFRYEIQRMLHSGEVHYARVTAEPGAVLRQRSSSVSPRLIQLKKGSIVKVTGQDSWFGEPEWVRLLTRSGEDGWCEARLVQPYGKDLAERDIRRDIAAFESKLRKTIKVAMVQRTLSLHPASKVADVKITTPLEPRTETIYSVEACSLAIGKYLGINKYRVDLRIRLNVDLDPNLLQSSAVRVEEVDVLVDERTAGFEVQEVASLLSNFRFLLNFL